MSDDEPDKAAIPSAEQPRATPIVKSQGAAPAPFAKGAQKTAPDPVRETHDTIMAMFEREWDRTGNPIWVWRAIANGAVGAGTGAPQFPMPAWCANYLRMVAPRIQALSEGQDWRKPANEFRDDLTLPLPRLSQARQMGPDAAMGLIPSALGLRSQGWNAFSKDAGAEARDPDYYRMAELMESEPSKAAARRAFMAETGRTDERWVRNLQRDAEKWYQAQRVPKP